MERLTTSPSGSQSRSSEVKKSEEILNLPKSLVQQFAHEVRNPLSMIKGTIQLVKLKQKEIDSKYLDSIIKEVDRINQTLEEFVALAKLHRGREFINLNNMVTDVVKLLQSEREMRQITVKLSCRHLDLWVEGYEELFKQVLFSLARNSMESMENEGILTFQVQLLSDKIAQIQISDTGSGFDPAIIDRIFDSHFMVKQVGTGFGLDICQRIIQEHHGDIFAENNADCGSTFYINLPTVEEALVE